jgi:pre-mRNA-splicing factor ATP-dependent RNA helicase DHX15/PRP43
MEVPLGSIVGLRHRDHDSTNNQTHLEVYTDGELYPRVVPLFGMSSHPIGITLALARLDPTLSSFGVVIIDEAHEYSRDADILLGHLKGLLNERDDLKVIVTSATIDTALFKDFFPQAVVEEVSGRQHKVTVNYLRSPPSDLIAEIIKTIIYVHCTQMPDDILVFVTGKDEINKVIDGVNRSVEKGMGPLRLCSLHGSHLLKDQNIAINAKQPHAQHNKLGRKVIVSTNSAETSLIVAGVTHIVDSCKAKINVWDPYTESFVLINQPISKASILHRKGRAGRIYEGMAWLTCTERGYQEDLVEHAIPQVLQGDMLSECLTILKLGHNPITFDYIVPPAPETIVRALGLLRQLGAVKPNGSLSSLGKQLTAIPTNVYAAMTLLGSPIFGCSDEIISVLAMLEATNGGSYLFRPGQNKQKLRGIKRKFQHCSGDHITLFNVYMAWREACYIKKGPKFANDNMLLEGALRNADNLRLHYLEAMNKIESWDHRELRRNDPHYYTRILQALAAGHFLHAAKRVASSNGYQLVRSGMHVSLSRYTDLGYPNEHNEWVIYDNCFNDGRNKELRVVSSITPELLIAARPEYWWDAEILPERYIKEGLTQTLTDMIGSGGITPAGFPDGDWPDVESSSWAGLARWTVGCMVADKELLGTTLPSWQKGRGARFAKVEQLKKWNLEKAIAAGFDDGSSRYDHPDKYHPSSFSIGHIDAEKNRRKGRRNAR